MDILKLLELIVEMLTLLSGDEKTKTDEKLKERLEKDYWEKISQEENPELHYVYGIASLVLRNHELAISAFKRAIEYHEKETAPSWVRYHYYQLLAYLEWIREVKIKQEENELKSICNEIEELREGKIKGLKSTVKKPDDVKTLEGLSYMVEMVGWKRICNIDKAIECRNNSEQYIEDKKLIDEFYNLYKC